MNYIIDESGRQLFCATKAYWFKEGLCAVQVGGKWGFINTSGKIVIPCQYDKVWGFENGAAVVMSNDKFGLINKSGKLLAPLQYKDYDYVPQPFDGVVCVNIGIGSNDKRIYKCIDIEGKTLFTKPARVPLEFSEGLASIWVSDGYGVIDKNGDFVIPVGAFDYIMEFKNGVAEVQKGILRGFINKSGQFIVPLEYKYFDNSAFPIVIAHSDKGVVCLDARTGTEITPLSKDKDKYKSSSFMNTDGMVIIDVNDSDIVYFYDILSRNTLTLSNIKEHWRFSNGLCAIASKKSRQSGFIDKTGTLVLTYDFGETIGCSEFHRGCCILNNKFVNKKGDVLRQIPPRHKVQYSSPNVVENGYWIEEGPDILTSKYGPYQGEALLDDNGKIVYKGFRIKTLGHSSLIPVKGANITGREKWGYINRAGKLVIPYQFTESSIFKEGFATVDEPPVGKAAKGCYIATSVYGSYDVPNVWVLRRFRDLCLSKFTIGRTFIRIYYRISPTLVKIAGDSKIFKGIFKPLLDRFVSLLRNRGYSDSPYSD